MTAFYFLFGGGPVFGWAAHYRIGYPAIFSEIDSKLPERRFQKIPGFPYKGHSLLIFRPAWTLSDDQDPLLALS